MKKAVYYERVSTLNDEQTNSLENQRKLCEDFLKKHSEIILAEPIDSYTERVSGKSDLREKYIEMMTRVSKGDIDYILVKDLKRLSRSTEVSAQLRNQCKKYGVKLILLSNNQIYDPNAEGNRMLYGFEALVNEEVVYRQSEYGRIAHKQKMDAKRLSIQNCTFGYRWDKESNDMVICDEEAETIRQLFELLVFKDYGAKELREFLAKEKEIKVSAVTVRHWIQETAYIGTFHMNKKGSILGVGAGQKTKRYKKPKEEWVEVERPDLAIVDKDLFSLAQKLMESRKRIYDADKNGNMQARFRGTHLFSSKVFCEACGKSYTHKWSDRKRMVGIYRDSYVQKRHDATTKCENVEYSRIYEDELEMIVRQAINAFIKDHIKCFDTVLQALQSAVADEIETGNEMNRKRKRLNQLEAEADKVLQSYLDATGTIREALSQRYEKITQNISALKNEIAVMEEHSSKEEELERRIQVISAEMDKLKEINVLDRVLVENFVDKIYISKDGKVKVVLKVGETYIQQLHTWQEQKELKRVRQKAEPVFFFKVYVLESRCEICHQEVVMMDTQGMKGRCQLLTPTLPETCYPVWKQWFLWGLTFHWRLSGDRLHPVWIFWYIWDE